MDNAILARSEGFCARFGLRVPILLAPMAGACTPPLSIAVANAGGAGACGALLMSPEQIASWVAEFRAASTGAFQLNTWIRDPKPSRDAAHEAEIRAFLERFGPRGSDGAADVAPPDF
ncbi:MAG TPA: nitronate monooxygenase, partial [Rhodanobacteraceae bacterium]